MTIKLKFLLKIPKLWKNNLTLFTSNLSPSKPKSINFLRRKNNKKAQLLKLKVLSKSELITTKKSKKLMLKEMKLKRKWMNWKLITTRILTCTKINKTSWDISSMYKMRSITREKERKKKKNGEKKKKKKNSKRRNNSKKDKREENKEKNKKKKESKEKKKESKNFKLKDKHSSIETQIGDKLIFASSWSNIVKISDLKLNLLKPANKKVQRVILT